MQSEDLIELNFKGLEMRKWNTPTEKAQRADKKNMVICLVIVMFTPRVMVVKILRMADSLNLLLMTKI